MGDLIAIYPGTFDPITLGHLDLINRASNIFSNLIVAVAEDNNKSPIFDLDKRVKIAREEINTNCEGKAKIQVMPFKGLLVDFANKNKAKVIVRGMRAVSDFEYEFQMAYMNSKLSPEIHTVFLPASEKSHFISSKFVKQLARLKGDLSQFVSPGVENKLIQYFNNE